MVEPLLCSIHMLWYLNKLDVLRDSRLSMNMTGSGRACDEQFEYRCLRS